MITKYSPMLKVREKPGRPQEHEPAPLPEAKEICQRCQGEIKQGVLHLCNITSLEKNMKDRLKKMPTNSKQRMAAALLDDIREEQGVRRNGLLEIKTRGPHPKIVGIGSLGKFNITRKMSKETLMRIKMRLNLSGEQTKLLRTSIRTVFGRKSVEDGAGDYQTELNHRLAGFFKLVTLKIKKTHKSVVTWEDRYAGVCHDTEGLITFLMETRDINPDEEEILFGFDDGQGSLKLMMLIQKLEDHDVPDKKRPKYADGVFSQSFKNTSVKKLIVMACVPNCQEHYENVQQILEQVDLSGVDMSESADIKMVLTQLGKQGASSTHNCILGDGKAPYTEGCNELTFGELRGYYER